MRQRYVYITIKIKGNCPVTAAAAATRLISSHLDECQNQPSHSLDQLYSSLSLSLNWYIKWEKLDGMKLHFPCHLIFVRINFSLIEKLVDLANLAAIH